MVFYAIKSGENKIFFEKSKKTPPKTGESAFSDQRTDQPDQLSNGGHVLQILTAVSEAQLTGECIHYIFKLCIRQTQIVPQLGSEGDFLLIAAECFRQHIPDHFKYHLIHLLHPSIFATQV